MNGVVNQLRNYIRCYRMYENTTQEIRSVYTHLDQFGVLRVPSDIVRFIITDEIGRQFNGRRTRHLLVLFRGHLEVLDVT